LQRYGVDCQAVSERYGDDTSMATWFGEGLRHKARFPNAQRLDFDGLDGQLMSSSCAADAGRPNHAPMLIALHELFDRTAQDGTVEFVYAIRLYAGNAL